MPHFVAEWSATAPADPGDPPLAAPAGFAPLWRFAGEPEPDGGDEPSADLRTALTRELAAEFAERQRETEAACAAELAAQAAACDEARRRWQEEFATQIAAARDAALHDAAREAARLAVQLAEKIVRATVEHDETVLIRAIETVLHKVDASVQLVVTAHPDDAARLAGDDALLARLRIAAVKEDRRIERGGCLVAADRQEWNATVAKQLATLAEKVDEVFSVGPTTNRPEQHEPAGVE